LSTVCLPCLPRSIKSLIDAIVCFTRKSTYEKNVLRLQGDWF